MFQDHLKILVKEKRSSLFVLSDNDWEKKFDLIVTSTSQPSPESESSMKPELWNLGPKFKTF